MCQCCRDLGRIAFSIPKGPPILVKEAACMFVPWRTCTSQQEWSVWTVNTKQLYQTWTRLAIERNACLECLPLPGVDISWHIVPVWAEDQRQHGALTCPKPDPTASLLCQVTFWSCSSSSLALVAQFNHLTHRRAWPYTLCWLCFWKSHGSRVHPTKNTWNKSKHVAKNMDTSCHLDLTPAACSIPGNCCGWICIHELMRNIEDNLSR